MIRSLKHDSNGNILVISHMPAEESGEGFIDFNSDLPENQLLFNCIIIDGNIELRSELITKFHEYKNGKWVLNRKKQIQQEILDLEQTVTPRRLREAILGDKTWLLAIESSIQALRSESNGIRDTAI